MVRGTLRMHVRRIKLKVKVTLVQALRLCTGRTAHRGSRGIALPFHDHSTRMGWGVSLTPRPLFTPGKNPVPIVQEAGWAPQLVWTGAENLTPTGIQSPDHPARSQSLYRLRYPAHMVTSCLKGKRYVGCNTCSRWGATGLKEKDYWILSWLKRGGTEAEATLLLCHRNPKRKHSGPLKRIWKNEANLMAKFGTEICCHSMTWMAE